MILVLWTKGILTVKMWMNLLCGVHCKVGRWKFNGIIFQSEFLYFTVLSVQ